MKVDLVYPKIPENSNNFTNKCIAFEKYDGTNLHWCWNYSDGWHKFGTRRTQFPFTKKGILDFSNEHYELANAPYLFNDLLRDSLTTLFACQHNNYCEFTLFTEFYGPNSFAGNHSLQDELDGTQQLIMIDLSINKKILLPEEFIRLFSGEICKREKYPLAKVIYEGKYTGQFTEDVRKGKYGVNEGVVCKGSKDGELFMTKIKTKDYLKRLTKR